MNLTFTRRTDGKYEATATVNASFNLHLEFARYVNTSVFQRTAGTEYAGVRGSNSQVMTYDNDFFVEVYPKDIKVVCEDNPQVAILTEAQ